ncbi:hypothetical protein PG996_012016 [Apiospora saccharicola]|uniref:SMP domain-containing protein n=1 Tax=Apiospora saccharicola TaxID=335842 RepID=A0ABR1U3R3_9PEZI
MSSDTTATNKENTNPMTKENAARIQAAEAKKSGTGETPADSFLARAQSVADKNDNDEKVAVPAPASGDKAPSGGDQKSSFV